MQAGYYAALAGATILLVVIVYKAIAVHRPGRVETTTEMAASRSLSPMDV